MRINDQILKNVEIAVVEDKKVLSDCGLRRVFVYEARVKTDKQVRTKRSESLSELQSWIVSIEGAAS